MGFKSWCSMMYICRISVKKSPDIKSRDKKSPNWATYDYKVHDHKVPRQGNIGHKGPGQKVLTILLYFFFWRIALMSDFKFDNMMGPGDLLQFRAVKAEYVRHFADTICGISSNVRNKYSQYRDFIRLYVLRLLLSVLMFYPDQNIYIRRLKF